MLTFESLSDLHFVKIIKQKNELSLHLKSLRSLGKRVALVPTMGALHEGHLSLLAYAKQYSDVLVCSIFVNPTQFNDAEDLEKYPRPKEKDLQKLREAGCDVVFMPDVEEMYADAEVWFVDLEGLDQILEGAFRPGHYQGVTQIVKKLFDVVQPDVACFGQKDYQQYLVIEKLIERYSLPIQLIMCPTVRESGGLAMSSRNERLSDHGRRQAAVIYDTIKGFEDDFALYGLEKAKELAKKKLYESEGVELEYFEVRDPLSLQGIDPSDNKKKMLVLVAAWLEGIRLIDNILLDA